MCARVCVGRAQRSSPLTKLPGIACSDPCRRVKDPTQPGKVAPSPPSSISLHAATFVFCVSSYSSSLHECVRACTCACTCVNSASPLKLKTLSCLLSAAVNKHFPLFPYQKSWQSHSTVDTCACVRGFVCVCQNHQGLIKDCLPA